MSADPWTDATPVVETIKAEEMLAAPARHLRDKCVGGRTEVILDGRAPQWLKDAITRAHREDPSRPLSELYRIAREAYASAEYSVSVSYPMDLASMPAYANEMAAEYAEGDPTLSEEEADARYLIAQELITSLYRAAGSTSAGEMYARNERAMERDHRKWERERAAAISAAATVSAPIEPEPLPLVDILWGAS